MKKPKPAKKPKPPAPKPDPIDMVEGLLPRAKEAIEELTSAADSGADTREEDEDALRLLEADLPELTTVLEGLAAALDDCDRRELQEGVPDLVEGLDAMLDGAEELARSAVRRADGV